MTSGLLETTSQQNWASASPGPSGALVPVSQPQPPSTPDASVPTSTTTSTSKPDSAIHVSADNKPPLVASVPHSYANYISSGHAQSLAAYNGGLSAAYTGLSGGLASAGLATPGLTSAGLAHSGLAHSGLASAGLATAGSLTAGLVGGYPGGGLNYSSGSLLGAAADYSTYSMSPGGGVKLLQNPYDPAKAAALSLSNMNNGLISNPLNAAAAALAPNANLAGLVPSYGTGLSASPLSIARLHGGTVGIPMGQGLAASGPSLRTARVYKGTESGI